MKAAVKKIRWGWVIAAGAQFALSPIALGMELVSDADLSDISGQQGIDITISSNAIGSASTNVAVNMDPSTTSSAALREVGMQLRPIGNSGASSGSPFKITTNVDAGTVSGVPRFSLNTDWTRMRVSTSNLDLLNASSTPSTYGLGALVIDTSGSLVYRGRGLFNGAVDSSRLLHLTIGTPQVGVSAPGSYGQIYYRQSAAANSPELIFDKFYLDVGLTAGTGGGLGFCASGTACGTFGSTRDGLYLNAPHLDVTATWATNYRSNTSLGSYTTANNDVAGIAYWGWTGGYNNAELLVSGGGVWPGGSAAYDPKLPTGRTGGLNLAFHGDYDSNFSWLVGQAGGLALLKFGNWTKLSGATWALDVPNITLDMVNSGQGVGGLCWGASAYGTSAGCTGTNYTRPNGQTVSGRYIELAPDATAMATIVRGLSLQAYSSNVQVLDDMNKDGDFSDTVLGKPETESYGWSLMYTMGAFDGNIYLYPGNAANNGNGLRADMIWMSQSFSNGSNKLLGNTNFMIGDTTAGTGIGLFQANLLYAAKKLGVELLPTGIQLQTADARFAVQGRFGGGTIPNLSAPNIISDVDMNLEFSKLNMLLYPATSNGYPYLGYSMAAKFGTASAGIASADPDGSYISLSEPSRSDVNFRVAKINGDVELQNGQIFLISGADAVNAPDQVKRLRFANDILVGTTVSGGSPVTADIKFSGSNLGSIAIPSGRMYSSLTLKPQ